MNNIKRCLNDFLEIYDTDDDKKISDVDNMTRTTICNILHFYDYYRNFSILVFTIGSWLLVAGTFQTIIGEVWLLSKLIKQKLRNRKKESMMQVSI
jgi:hypothetical protein